MIPCDLDNDFVQVAHRRSTASKKREREGESEDLKLVLSANDRVNDTPVSVMGYLAPRFSRLSTGTLTSAPWTSDCSTRDAIEQFMERFRDPLSRHIHAGVNNAEALRQYDNDNETHRKFFVKTARKIAELPDLKDEAVEECARQMGESRLSESELAEKYHAMGKDLQEKTAARVGQAAWFDRRLHCLNKVTGLITVLESVSSLEHVLTLKLRVSTESNASPASMDFYYKGNLLENFSTLQDCGVPAEETIDWIHHARITGRTVLGFRQGRFLQYALEDYLPRVILGVIQQYV